MVRSKKRVPSKKRISNYPDIDYTKYLEKCVADCEKWGIPISKKIRKNANFVKRSDCYALCELLDSGYFQISYTTAGFDEYGVSEKAIYNLFMHELCHTIKGCFNHLKTWKMWVKKLNEHGCKINPYPFGNKKEYEDFY